MRLCYYNPHAVNIGFGETLLSYLARIFGVNKNNLKKHNLKYEFLLNILKNRKFETAIVVDGSATSLSTLLEEVPFFRHNYFIYSLVSRVEIYIWCLLNQINPLRHKIIFSEDQLDNKSDILFGFAFCTYNFFNNELLEKSIIKSFSGVKLLHASHFYKSTKKVALNIKKVGITLMVAEANLKKSAYFNKFFDYIDNVYVLPHVLRQKYKSTLRFEGRKNYCLALGTLVIENEKDHSNRDHIDFFKTNTLHPMRKVIFENKDSLSNLIDCCINFHNEKRLAIAHKSALYNRFNFFKFIYDLFFLSEGKDYHNMDIVKKYNDYKMFIAPEENIGLSSINFVEGMACGCAYIGLDNDMYKDLGMIAGHDFIAYDGTLADLKSKIKYYQNHENELVKIAENGYRYARENFSEKKVTADFWNYLNNLTINK